MVEPTSVTMQPAGKWGAISCMRDSKVPMGLARITNWADLTAWAIVLQVSSTTPRDRPRRRVTSRWL